MSQTSHSPNVFFFFTQFIPSEILPEIMFCHVQIIYLLIYRNYGAKSRNSRNKFFCPKLVSELPGLIFAKSFLNYLHNALKRKHKENDRSSG